MNITIIRADEINAAIDRFSMTAALDNMGRYGSQLCMAPSDAGLLDSVHEELSALLSAGRGRGDEMCSPDAVTALRQTLLGVTISMAAGSSGGRDIDQQLQEAAEAVDAANVERPCVTVFPISWRRDVFGQHRPAHAVITPSQIDAIPAPS